MGMTLLVIIMLVVFAYWFIKHNNSSKSQPKADYQPVDQPSLPTDNEIARDALTRVSNTCQEIGGDGYSSLILAASSDGKISRDELRVAMWFCEACGAKFLEEDVSYVSKLNSGVKMVASSAQTAEQLVAGCKDMELPMLLRLYAAHTSIGKPWNKTARRSRSTLAVIENMIERKIQEQKTKNG